VKLKNILLEITKDQALQIFGISDVNKINPNMLKKIYRDLSKKYHPDINKSKDAHDKMRKINDAYKILSSYKNTIRQDSLWDIIAKKHREFGKIILEYLLHEFKPEIYINYFNSFTSEKFNWKFINKYPDESIVNPSFAGFEVNFYTENNNIVFQLQVSAPLTDIMRNKELKGGDKNFRVYVTTIGFTHNKKQKITKCDWSSKDNHKFLIDPELIFPKNKIEKIITTGNVRKKFSKRDMLLFFELKLNADIDGDRVKIPILNEYKYILFRTVIFRYPGWNAMGLYQKINGMGYKKITTKLPYLTLEETEKDALFIFEMIKECEKQKNLNDIISTIIKYTNNKKAEQNSKWIKL